MAEKNYLTPYLAKTLLGKTVLCSYNRVNTGDHKFEIVRISDEKRGNSTCRLITRFYKALGKDANGQTIYGELDPVERDYIYEFEGVFCRGSGAERLSVEQIF